MPQDVESLILELDKLPKDDSKHIPLNCPWTITYKDESLTVTITCLKRTFKYEFCLGVINHPQEAPNVSKRIDLKDHHALLGAFIDALNSHEKFFETHLKTHQLDILKELMEYLDLKFDCSITFATQLSHFDLVIDIFSGTDPDQDAESFSQLIERKTNFALGDAFGDGAELTNYTFRKKALFSFSLRGPAAD